jgi:hypothetical protein
MSFNKSVRLFVLPVSLLLLAMASYGLSQVVLSTEVPRWIATALEWLGYLLLVGAGIATIYAVFLLLRSMVPKPDSEPAPIPTEAKPIQQAMVKLSDLLAQLEPNVQEADAKLLDAQTWTGALVAQVLRVVEKIEEMEGQVKALGEAIEAINGGERDKVAYAAGKVADPTIRQILRSPYIVKRPDFRADAITLISGEMGTLEQWGRSYGNFVTALFAQISMARDKAVMLQAGRDMLEASQPVLLIQMSLNEASDALRLRAQPALRMMARQALPAPVVSLLD